MVKKDHIHYFTERGNSVEEIAQQPIARQLLDKVTAVAASVRGKLPELSKRKIILISIPLLILIIAGILLLNIKHVRIDNAGKVSDIYTFSTNPSQILLNSKINTTPYDKVNFSGFDRNSATIKIFPAFAVSVTADNKTQSIRLAEGTVKDVLNQLDIKVGDDDIISSPLTSAVTSGQKIVINRVTYDEKVTTEPIPYNTVKEESAELARGTTKVAEKGKEGVLAITTKVKYIDGKEQNSVTTDKQETTSPVTEKIIVGTASATPYSQLAYPSSLKLNANGVPVSYSRVYTGRATAYHYGKSTASGRSLMVGRVAVDPDKIPYGTKLYIMSPDGRFVYGYAEAADTGTFVNDGSGIITDLYFASNDTCRRFGIKTVSIYVLN